VEAVGNSRRRRLVGPTPRLAPGCCAPDPLPAISPPGEFSGTAGSLDLYPQYPAVLRSDFTIFTNYLIKGINLSNKVYGFYFLIFKRAAQNFPKCYGTHLCAWPALCPKLAAIPPAAPFAHYDQLVAQALSTTDLVFEAEMPPLPHLRPAPAWPPNLLGIDSQAAPGCRPRPPVHQLMSRCVSQVLHAGWPAALLALC